MGLSCIDKSKKTFTAPLTEFLILDGKLRMPSYLQVFPKVEPWYHCGDYSYRNPLYRRMGIRLIRSTIIVNTLTIEASHAQLPVPGDIAQPISDTR